LDISSRDDSFMGNTFSPESAPRKSSIYARDLQGPEPFRAR
jgi:hypothetical protein